MRSGILHLVIKNQLAELERLSARIEEFAEERDLSPRMAQEINLCLDELVTNIVSYGYADDAEHEIHIRMKIENGRLVIELEDDGKPFNPLEADDPDVDKPLEERRIGGLGIFFVKKIMSDVTYERREGKNVLTLAKAAA